MGKMGGGSGADTLIHWEKDDLGEHGGDPGVSPDVTRSSFGPPLGKRSLSKRLPELSFLSKAHMW